MRTAITTGPQTTSAAGALTGVYDASALTGDFTIDLEISALAAGKTARIVIEDQIAAADDFSDALAVAEVEVTGPIVAAAPRNFSWRKYDLPNVRVGVAHAKLRAKVIACDSAAALTANAMVDA